jgi:integrase
MKRSMKQQMKASAYHLKPADIKKLTLASPNFRDRCIVKTLYWAGLRRHELVALDVRDLDFERKRITVQNGKGGKTRIVPIIDDEYLSDLAHLIGLRKQGEPTAPPPEPPYLSTLGSSLPQVKGLYGGVDTKLPRAPVLPNHYGHVRHHLD